jgi:hypothetical protein
MGINHAHKLLEENAVRTMEALNWNLSTYPPRTIEKGK